jgi:hypothetical protein
MKFSLRNVLTNMIAFREYMEPIVTLTQWTDTWNPHVTLIKQICISNGSVGYIATDK